MQAGNSGDTIQVGDWTVTPSLDSISRGSETQKLEPRTMRLLLCLVESAGGVVSVDHLLAEVWAGVVVGPASVYQAVSQLRKLLHDVDPEPTYIVTVPRKGYRLIAAVRRDAGVPKPDLARAPKPADVDARAHEGARAQEDACMHDAVPGQSSAGHTAGEGAADRKYAESELAPATMHQPPALTAPANAGTARGPLRLAVIAAVVLMATSGAAWLWLKKSPMAQADAASIVVLPFVDMTAEKTGQPFCDGLTEELSNWLSQIPTLRVVARTSAFAFRGAEQDVRNIGKTLNTSHILEGSMRRSGDHMRITVQLIDARNGYHLWSAEYDQPIEDTIAMQDEISRAVAQNLQIRLTSQTNLQFAARRSENPRAYQMYLSARYFQHQRTLESNNRAIDLYSQVIAADPKFALAYVGLSYSRLNQKTLDGRSIREIAVEIEPLIATAMKLDPQLGEVYAVRAALRSDENQTEAAKNDLRLAISLNPNDSMAIAELGRLWIHAGRPRDALVSFNRAAVLDPLDFRLQTQLCLAFEDLARFQEAQSACTRAHQLQPDNAEVIDGLTWLAWSRGAIPEALQWNLQSLKIAPDDFDLYWTRAELYSTLALAKRTRATLERGRAATNETEMSDVLLGRVAYLEGGADGLREHLAAAKIEHSTHFQVLLETSYLRLLLKEPSLVQDLVGRALQASDLDPQTVDTPWAARFGESSQLNLAVAEFESGDRLAAQARLDALLAMLDRMVDSGVERYATYELRAKTQALRGHPDEAMQDLAKAGSLGWRGAWWAQHEPYLASLRSRPDFQKLMDNINESNSSLLGSLGLIDLPDM